jgi:homocysteine S-methyltransferase
VTVVLDGGLATELERAGHDLSDRLWSARLLLDDPDAIEAVHLAYFKAGAQVATTASYQATVPGFVAAGRTADDALEAIARSVSVAARAADRHAEAAGVERSTLLVAGSVGPYGAMLADGSEYRGDYDPGESALREFHAPRIDALLEAGADLLAMETIPTVREASVLVRLLDEAGAIGWLSFQCRDATSTAAGEPIAEAVAATDGVAGVVAVGVNCTAPRHAPGLLSEIRGVTDLPSIAYPNGGDRWEATTRRWVIDGDGDDAGGYRPAEVASWTDLGADWLGGCCGTGPADIRALAGALAA